ncbi:nuclear transport factor 2 family protein [Roseateles asaccharophilus]|uniref:Ketosteroid isomerase-like protein n=1 Tax=Roseateles asaccharophilus TaxID=582607 RepID=A0ABU2A841_9BURK|nr:nuclear transport factor 2 family protein [Roseateles asaccharophilus]MDR7333310.1 ketosteroid isomerase-like protein [Roseateles asaccharophilus]
MRPLATPRHTAGSFMRPHQWMTGVLIAALSLPGLAQDATRSGPLHDELARMDAALFEAAFVTCDAARFRAIFTDDAEFYHDKTGASFGEAVKVMKSCPRDNGVTRTLVPGSLEVYPMQGYGAVQIGRHVFAKKGEPGSEEAKFVHLWKREATGWRLARVLSFDHRPSAPKLP